ncbi:MAG TPA: M20/M25/M40 family metallo-hydrolase, partial [Terriglobales bacterium]|nr:M20/M25/M40 family metallo-hydrolase [Terriglobales bacterium]
DSPFEVLANGRYVAKAWDDRVGCAVMIEMMKRLAAAGSHPNQIYYAATVQEEIGERGASSAAEAIKPDIGLALEVGITSDIPGVSPESAQERLGGGPGIFLYDTSELPNRKLVAFVEQVANAANIPLQTDLVSGYGDDSSVIQKSNGGVPTINIVIPTRYTHAHDGMIDRSDFDRTVDLMVALVQKLDAATVARLRDFGQR